MRSERGSSPMTLCMHPPPPGPARAPQGCLNRDSRPPDVWGSNISDATDIGTPASTSTLSASQERFLAALPREGSPPLRALPPQAEAAHPPAIPRPRSQKLPPSRIGGRRIESGDVGGGPPPFHHRLGRCSVKRQHESLAASADSSGHISFFIAVDMTPCLSPS